jgi:HK97 family phage portal protein
VTLMDAARSWLYGPPAREALPAVKALSDAVVPRDRSWVVNWPWQDNYATGLGGGSVPLPGPLWKTYDELYAAQQWVYAAVNRISYGIAVLPLKAYKRGAGGARDRLYRGDSELVRLVESPYGRWPSFRFKQRIIADLCTYGNAIAVKVARRETDVPDAIRPVSPVGWWLGDDGTYRRRDADGNERSYEPWRVVHFHFEAPGYEDYGLSPIEPLRMTLAIEYAAQKLGVNLFEKGAMPSGGLSTDQDLTDPQIARLREQFNAVHQGVANSGKVVILPNGLKYAPFSMNLADAAVIQHRQLARTEVAGVYHVPPSILGDHEHSTFSNVTEMHREWYQDSLAPYRALYEETWQTQVIDPVPAFAGQFVEYDVREMLKGDIAQQTAAYQAAITGGWMTPNEVRQLENLPRITDQPEADQIHIPLNLGPVPEGMELPTVPGPLERPDEPPKALPPVLTTVRKRLERDAQGNVICVVETHRQAEEVRDGAVASAD